MWYVINCTLQLEFQVNVDVNTRPIVKVGTDDRVAKFDATMWYVINGTLQQEILTCLCVRG